MKLIIQIPCYNEAETLEVALNDLPKHISRFHIAAIYYLSSVHKPNGKARKVIFVLGVEAGHFRSFAANKRAACLSAAFCHTAYYFGYFFGIVFAAGDIVKKEKWLCSAADYVVYTHCHAVYTYSIVFICKKSNFKLCAYAVGARYQYGLIHIFSVT